MSDFEWQTADEHNWLEEPPPPPAGKPVNWRLYGSILLLIALLIGGGRWLFNRVDRQVGEVTSTVEAELLAAHALASRAAANQDVELFALRLDAADQVWRQAQLDLLAGGGLYDRAAFGLDWQEGETAVADIYIAPNLQTAELQFDHIYLAHPTATHSETIRLRQTIFYQYDEELGWLVSHPSRRYWEGWAAHQANYLTVTFPRRDEEWAARLTLELDSLLAQLCRATPGLVCPNFHIQLTLNENLTYLRSVEPVGLRRARWEIELPAPSLVGAPQDERGYEALYRGYAALLVAALLPDLTGWQCCENRLFYEAAQARLLAQLDLRPWPLRPDDYRQMYADPRLLSDLYLYWGIPDAGDIPWEIFALVAFIETAEPQMSAAQWPRTLMNSSLYGRWLRRVTPNYADAELELAWLQFVYEQASRRLSGQLAYPAQDVQLMCNLSQNGYALLNFAPDAARWRPELPDRRFHYLQPTADYQGVILGWQSDPRQTFAPQSRIVHWQAGVETPLLQWTGARLMAVQAGGASGQIAFLAQDPTRELWRNVVWHGLDMERCGPDGCAYYPLQGYPIWSPDGERLLLVEERISLGDSQGRRRELLAAGSEPIWLTGEWLAYAQQREGERPSQLIVHSLEEGVLAALTVAELTGWLPPEAPPWVNWQFAQLTAHPDEPERIFFTVDDPRRRQWGHYLFSWDWRQGEVELLYESAEQLYTPKVSPDGRWLTFSSRDDLYQRHQLVLLHLASGSQYHFLARTWTAVTNYHWSADGRWLVRPDANYIQFIAPLPDGEIVQEIAPHEYGGCVTAVWVDR